MEDASLDLALLLVAARWLHLLGSALCAGLLVCHVAAVAPAAAARGLVAGLQRRTAMLAMIAAIVSMVSGVLWFLAQAQQMSDLSFADAMAMDNLAAVAGTRFGNVMAVRLLLAMLAVACLLVSNGPRAMAGAGVAALTGLGALAWTGHAGASGNLHLAADVVHLIAAGVWLGCIAGLVTLFSPRGLACASGEALVVAASRLSLLAILCVAVLVGTGIADLWFVSRPALASLDGVYVGLLLVKLALVGAMLVLGYRNRMTLRRDKAADAPAARSVCRMARAEVGLGVLVLGVVSVLGITAPHL